MKMFKKHMKMSSPPPSVPSSWSNTCVFFFYLKSGGQDEVTK